jgi:hypothetical protein
MKILNGIKNKVMILPQQQLFIDLDNHLFQVYAERELKCLSEYEIENKKVLTIYHKIIDKKNRVNDFNSVEYIFDIEFISQDIKFFTGLLYILRPFINIPSKEHNTYFQNRYDHRYLIFASVVHQNVYNFWDRIGDLLYCFFDTGLSERNVYLSKVLNNFPVDYRESEVFKELSKIYEQKVKPILDSRTQIVHYKQLETKHHLGIFQNYDDSEAKKALEKEKNNYPDFFKEQLALCNYGFENTLKLIDLLEDKQNASLPANRPDVDM